MLKRASEVIASGDESSIVDYAIEVNRQIVATTAELEQVKSHLRSLALDRTSSLTSGSVELDGCLGAAKVTFTADTVKPKKGRDLKDLEANLSREAFMRLFHKEIVVSPVEAFQEVLARMPALEREIVDRFLEIRPSTPKVNLPR